MGKNQKPVKPESQSDLEKFLAGYGITKKQLEMLLVASGQKKVKPLELYLGDSNEYAFGAIGDTHLCSKQERIAELTTFYEICRQRGIKDVFHAGDILDAQDVYPGHIYEVHTIGVDNQINYTVRKYPRVEGITTHFILGNHDYRWYQVAGVNVGERIAASRPDLDFRGAFLNDVFEEGTRFIRLLHPLGGMPYALSYRGQKLSEQIPSGEKPRILLIGHLHVGYYFIYRNIHVLGVGCFQGQTSLTARMSVNPAIGGWIVAVKFGKDRRKSIVSIKPEFIPFYGGGDF